MNLTYRSIDTQEDTNPFVSTGRACMFRRKTATLLVLSAFPPLSSNTLKGWGDQVDLSYFLFLNRVFAEIVYGSL